MKIQEAIEFLKNTIYLYRFWNFGDEAPIGKVKYLHCVNDIIKLLQRDEKYKAIVKEIEYNLDWHKPECPFSTPDGELIDEILEMIDKIKQKYFPEGDIEEVVNGITEQMKEGAEIARKEMKTNETEVD